MIAQAVLFVLCLIGGSSGSTAGGIKVIRVVILCKQALNELRKIIYPRGMFNVTLNKKPGRRDVVYGVAGFFFLYLFVIAILTLVVSAAGYKILDSFSASVSILSNTGIGFGAIGPGGSYGHFPAFIKWLFSLVMIAGRLELWTVFVLLSPAYWRR
jgi:trk system potassium uptake protein TrkH